MLQGVFNWMCQTIFYFPGRVFALMHLQVRDARRLHISQSSSVRSEGGGAVNQGAIFLQSLSGRYEDSVRLERKKGRKPKSESVFIRFSLPWPHL